MELLKDIFKAYFRAGIYFLQDNQTGVKKSHQENAKGTRKHKAVFAVFFPETSEMVTASWHFLQKQINCYPVGFSHITSVSLEYAK